MPNEMTQLSKKIYDKATSGFMTVHEAVEFLEREAKIRTLREKLEKFSKGRELRETLVTGLMHNHPDLSNDSASKRVRGWLNKDSTQSVKKQDAIEICFILKLSIDEADQLVALISEETLHWRSPDEIVSIFALKQGMDFLEAQKLNQRMAETLAAVSESKELQENSFTPIIRTEISGLQTEAELTDYLQDAVLRLGRCHNSAYKIFMEMLDMLEHPQEDDDIVRAEVFDSERLTVRDILKEYLYEKNVLYAKEMTRLSKKENSKLTDEEKKVFTIVQKSVSASWPDETTLSKMKSRKTDVTRKVLILLFLATDPGPELQDEGYELSEDEIFKDLYQELNSMLTLCGFSALDPRSPFDWLILYCMCVPDMFDVDIRMKEIFKEMFGERPVTKDGQ